jgi:hypothetical protein
VGEAFEERELRIGEYPAFLQERDAQHADEVGARAERDPHDAVERRALEPAVPPLPGLVVVDGDRLAPFPYPAGQTLAFAQALADVARERARADGDAELLFAVAQVDVRSVRADELARAGGDALEELLRVELVDELERRVVQRAQLGVAALELLLGRLALADVEHEALRVRRPAVRVSRDGDLVENPDDASVARDRAVFGRERASLRVVAAVFLEHALAVVRMEHLGEEVRVAHPVQYRVAEDRLDLRARVDRGAGLVQPIHVHGERKLLHEAAIVLLGLAQPLLDLAPLVQRLDELRCVLGQPLVAGLERARHLTEDREEGRVEERQREGERERDGSDGLADVRSYGRVVLKDLERSRRLRTVRQVDGHPGLQRFEVLAAAPLVVQRCDLLDGLAAERPLELGLLVLADQAVPDERAVVRVRDDPAAAPELDADDVARQLVLEHAVQLFAPLGGHRPREVRRAQQRGGAARDLARDALRVAQRTSLLLRADNPEDGEPRERQREGAVDGEAQDEARRPRARWRRRGHVLVIGGAKRVLECLSWTDPGGICAS